MNEMLYNLPIGAIESLTPEELQDISVLKEKYVKAERKLQEIHNKYKFHINESVITLSEADRVFETLDISGTWTAYVGADKKFSTTLTTESIVNMYLKEDSSILVRAIAERFKETFGD